MNLVTYSDPGQIDNNVDNNSIIMVDMQKHQQTETTNIGSLVENQTQLNQAQLPQPSVQPPFSGNATTAVIFPTSPFPTTESTYTAKLGMKFPVNSNTQSRPLQSTHVIKGNTTRSVGSKDKTRVNTSVTTTAGAQEKVVKKQKKQINPEEVEQIDSSGSDASNTMDTTSTTTTTMANAINIAPSNSIPKNIPTTIASSIDKKEEESIDSLKELVDKLRKRLHNCKKALNGDFDVKVNTQLKSDIAEVIRSEISKFGLPQQQQQQQQQLRTDTCNGHEELIVQLANDLEQHKVLLTKESIQQKELAKENQGLVLTVQNQTVHVSALERQLKDKCDEFEMFKMTIQAYVQKCSQEHDEEVEKLNKKIVNLENHLAKQKEHSIKEIKLWMHGAKLLHGKLVRLQQPNALLNSSDVLDIDTIGKSFPENEQQYLTEEVITTSQAAETVDQQQSQETNALKVESQPTQDDYQSTMGKYIMDTTITQDDGIN
ncbi:hypothetical protein SAMD00019534_118770 [Acytostelium subglobosum LB1]|uniref:hypothetical protein n=1 Tax=Acytostelium subglobosum LB1 TaxID=1410327 RepID=UPI000644B9A3|nr:hypothetical protein SAMD00019534_118770 [Acytostelium subglobosum LB1]GAM28701.1 hypothetical protein SAMD00019534_118770 [Acytostelium subglobosum LB1]|eukprot:XP_012748479.1 hypothetical protein SAMD00019534_118770 [Acytostelium subglobosum LB1]